MLWLIAFLLFLSFTLLILAFAQPKAKEDVSQRIQRLRKQVVAAQEPGTASPQRPSPVQRIGLWGAEYLAPLTSRLLTGKMAEQLGPRLRQAGWYEVTAAQFLARQVFSCLGFGLIFIFIFYLDRLPAAAFLPGLLASLALGFYYPRIRLNTALEERQKEILRGLPDVLDLLTVCIEAGMGLNAAIQKVVEQMRPGTLQAELGRTLQDIQMGMPRADALRGLAGRLDLKEVAALVLALIQSEQMGTPLGKTLRIQSEIVRQARWQRAQELAHKAPVKIVLPVVCLIFPVMFLIIFGPIVLNLLVMGR